MVIKLLKNRFKNRSILSTIAGLLLLILFLPLLIFLLNYLLKDSTIWLFGQQTSAEVVDLRLVRTSAEGETELEFKYYVDYIFQLPNGKKITGSSSLGAMEWSGLKKGGPVQIKYFPLYPSHNRLDDSRYISLYICSYIPITALILVGFLAAIYLIKPHVNQ